MCGDKEVTGVFWEKGKIANITIEIPGPTGYGGVDKLQKMKM